MVLLQSSEGAAFEVEEAVFMEFRAIHGGAQHSGGGAIPLSQVSGGTLAKVIDYCKKHVDHKLNPLPNDEINSWDSNFVDVDEEILLDLLVASHFLGVKDLFNLTCLSISEMIKRKTPGQRSNIDQLRALFTQMQILR